ncbi:MAG: hypothetical protein KDE05_10100 [Parvularculaceae bacterium]|nr:hypothetical protein [Parvularculaceae bacterium]
MARATISDKAKEEALKKLIRQTVDNAGAIAPDDIPHKVKERIRGQATGDLDVDAYIAKVLQDRKGR